MAINSLSVDVSCDKIKAPKSYISSNSSKTGNVSSRRLVKINFAAAEGSICSRHRKLKKNNDFSSPYLTGDSVHMFTRMTEKSLTQKNTPHFVSSFPLAVNIYKANSDEFKTIKKNNKKVKKSVLTLPNDPSPMPQTCTVSDLNDSEYLNKDNISKKAKKRNPVLRNKNCRSKLRDYDYYDRDARYCSQLNIDLDCSSTDLIKHINGDGKRAKMGVGSTKGEEKVNPHDVWAVLRNINRFQFRTSPPMSDDSFVSPKKTKARKRRNNRKDTRIVETCRTEEFAYISSYEVDSRSPHSFSQSSSIDRITVIDRQDDFNKLYEEFEKSMVKTKNMLKLQNKKNRNQNNNNNISTKKNNTKRISPKSNVKEAPNYEKKHRLRKPIDEPKPNIDALAICGPSDAVRNYVTLESGDDPSNVNLNNDINPEETKSIEFIYSGNSGSSKGVLLGETNDDKKDQIAKVSSNESHQQMNGITKVVLSKGQHSTTQLIRPQKKCESPKRKPKQQFLASNNRFPRLTQTDIRRRIANLHFPIVILGKDQLSSTYKLMSPNHIQFNGLDKHVWPFMLKWDDKNQNVLENNENEMSVLPRSEPNDGLRIKKYKTAEGTGLQKKSCVKPKQTSKDIKQLDETNNKKINRVEYKRITPPHELSNQIEQSEKQRPIRLLKDKMLKFLYKNSVAQNRVQNDGLEKGNPKNNVISETQFDNKIDASTETFINKDRNSSPKQVVNSIRSPKPLPPSKLLPPAKQFWAKGKWASDFIDNVIKKIKNGVYYNQENKSHVKKPQSQEAEIQTDVNNLEGDDSMKSISKITIKKKFDPCLVIPGFETDGMLPKLEIKTMTMNEISVKHCTTNVLVQFDVTMPTETVMKLKRSPSLIPLDSTESHTRVFKCKTSLVNAMLPAELCSILPKMLSNFTETRERLVLPPLTGEKLTFALTTIPEVNRCESVETNIYSIITFTELSKELRTLIDGFYFKPKTDLVKQSAVRDITKNTNNHTLSICDLKVADLLRPSLQSSLLNYPILLETIPLKISPLSPPIRNTCKALQLYSTCNRQLVSAYKRYNLFSVLEDVRHYTQDIKSVPFMDYIINNKVSIKITTTNTQGLQNSLVIDFSKFIDLRKNVLFDQAGIHYTTNSLDLAPVKCLENIKFNNKDLTKRSQNQVSRNKVKRNYVRLQKKCRSSSNITAEKTSTPLDKIANLDDFFVALGTGKLLAGAFDNKGGHKIMSTLTEMRSWTSEINQRQALLVLLLTNKKETSNLIRFRPVLLQGIAVHRITQANELDMEIEVIERENLRKITPVQYEGISYLPASVENRDTLLEELCWIAKTTASDYQRPFDESSEKLLKSLLEKRKKLNPSYLRVMARYVGLGLLKPLNKK